MSISKNVRADCQTTLEKCDKAVKACGDALDARKKEVSLCNLALTQTLEDNSSLRIQIDNKEAELNKWYRNPIIMGVLGVAAGVLVIEAVK